MLPLQRMALHIYILMPCAPCSAWHDLYMSCHAPLAAHGIYNSLAVNGIAYICHAMRPSQRIALHIYMSCHAPLAAHGMTYICYAMRPPQRMA